MANVIKVKTSVVYTLDQMSDESAGRLIKALLHYANGEQTTVEAEQALVYSMLKREIDEQKEKHDKQAEANRKNIEKRWASRDDKPLPEQPEQQEQPQGLMERSTEIPQDRIPRRPSPTGHRFQKPTIEEIQAYIAEKGYNVDGERWLAYYESNGWKVGKNPMKDWKAAIRTWAASDRKPQQKPAQRPVNVFADYVDDERRVW